jgi:hypothetical protein
MKYRYNNELKVFLNAGGVLKTEEGGDGEGDLEGGGGNSNFKEKNHNNTPGGNNDGDDAVRIKKRKSNQA